MESSGALYSLHFPPTPQARAGLAPKELNAQGSTTAFAPELQASQCQDAEQHGNQDEGHVQPPWGRVLG